MAGMGRRRFMEIAGSLAAPLSGAATPVRAGVIGVGRRGMGLLRILLNIPGVEVPAVCDTNTENLAAAAAAVEKNGQKRPEQYGGSPEAFRKLLGRDDLQAVTIATPWEWHAPMAVAAMKAGKYAGVVRGNYDLAQNIGLDGTPKFIIMKGGEVVGVIPGALPYSAFQQVLDQLA